MKIAKPKNCFGQLALQKWELTAPGEVECNMNGVQCDTTRKVIIRERREWRKYAKENDSDDRGTLRRLQYVKRMNEDQIAK